MKRIISLLVFIFLYPSIYNAQLNWGLDYDSANFAILVLDYNTYHLEKGYFTKYKYNSNIDKVGIPFNIIYNSPADSGNILFKYIYANDTLFYASIWWAGCGNILYPKVFDNANLFTYDSVKTSTPYKTENYSYIHEISEELFRIKADSAWKSIEKLSILKEFAKKGNSFCVGFYLYAPAVGMFRPEHAKWIIFLYRGQLIVSVQNEIVKSNDYALLQNYPNPFNPQTTIEYSIAKAGNVKILLYDLLGKEIEVLMDEFKNVGRHKIVFDGSNYSSGIYFYRIITSNYSQTKKLSLIK